MMALVLAAVFLGTILLILAGYVAVNRRQLVAGDTLRARLAPSAPASVAASSILKDETTSGFVALNRFLAGKDFTAALTAQIERSGSRLSVGEFVLLSLLCAGVGFLVGRSIGLLAAPLIAAACGYLPYLNLKRKAAKRLDNQWLKVLRIYTESLVYSMRNLTPRASQSDGRHKAGQLYCGDGSSTCRSHTRPARNQDRRLM